MTFEGIQYTLATNWFSHISVDFFKCKPINYLEIGTLYGANLFSVAKSYALHDDSKLYCIDPWEDYNDYPEYKNKQTLTSSCRELRRCSSYSKRSKTGNYAIDILQQASHYAEVHEPKTTE